MVGGVREVKNGTAPSLPVVLSALVVEILARGGRQRSVSSYEDSVWSTWQDPGPTPGIPKNSGNSTGTRGVFTGPKATQTLTPVP